MKRVEQYQRYAAECLALARKTENPEEKAQLLKLAEVWKKLAHYREADVTGE
jgi:hypothetical protein